MQIPRDCPRVFPKLGSRSSLACDLLLPAFSEQIHYAYISGTVPEFLLE